MEAVGLTGPPATFSIPPFADFTGTLAVPGNNGGISSPISLAIADSCDKNLGTPPDVGAGKPIFYEKLIPASDIVFTSAGISVTLTSPSMIFSPHIYAAAFFVGGTMVGPTITNLVPVGDTITFVVAPPGNKLKAGVPARIAVYVSS